MSSQSEAAVVLFVVIGAPSNDVLYVASGAAYAFVRSSPDAPWEEEIRLLLSERVFFFLAGT